MSSRGNIRFENWMWLISEECQETSFASQHSWWMLTTPGVPSIWGQFWPQWVRGWERGDIITQSPFSIPDIEHAQVSGSSRLWLLCPHLHCDDIIRTDVTPVTANREMPWHMHRAVTIHYSWDKDCSISMQIWRIVCEGGADGHCINVMLMLARSIYWLAVDIISWVLPMPVPVMHCPISDHTGAGARNYWPEPEPGEVKWGYCIQMTRDTGEAWPWSRDSICIVMSQ